MNSPDLNLLVALDALLREGSVAGAARRLRLSPSAMSRTLARLRDTTGDPLLVRAGRGLVPTNRAIELGGTVGGLIEDALAVLRPQETPDLATVERRFVLRTSDGFLEAFGPALLRLVGREAPGVRLDFVRKLDRDSGPLREGAVDLETGVVGGESGPELRTTALFDDRFVGVVRSDHELAGGQVALDRYLAWPHVLVSRRNRDGGLIDDALANLDARRRIAATVDGFAAALALSRGTDLVATLPDRHTMSLRDGLATFELPFHLPDITVSLLWHPRLDADPVHRWLRRAVSAVCGDRARERTVG